MKRSNVPPLGPRPLFVLEWERIAELKEAIHRFTEANWPLPKDLTDEYNRLTERLEQESPDNEIDRFRKIVNL